VAEATDRTSTRRRFGSPEADVSVRALDRECEIPDILVQRRRDKRAALRLMRRHRRKQGFSPKLLVTDKLRPTARLSGISG